MRKKEGCESTGRMQAGLGGKIERCGGKNGEAGECHGRRRKVDIAISMMQEWESGVNRGRDLGCACAAAVIQRCPRRRSDFEVHMKSAASMMQHQ